MLTIRLVGTVELQPNSAAPLSRGARETLAYLAINGPSLRSRLATALWPDSFEDQALYNLRRALTDLRRNLGVEADRLSSSAKGMIELDLGGVDVDLHRIRTAIATGDYACLASLCDGIPLEGIAGAWANPIRDAIRTELAQGLTLAARYAASIQDVSVAENFLRAALVQSHHSASVWQALVRLHSEAGDEKAARRIMVECDAAFARSGQPGPKPVWKVAETVTSTSFTPPPVVVGELVGREEILAQLSLDFEQFRVASLLGPGGMGKTRAATALAHRLQSTFPDGIAFVELAARTTEEGIRDAISRALGIKVDGGSAWLQTIVWLSRRRVMLILDNAEDVVGLVSDVVSEVISQTTNVRILVTSRVPLGLPTERRRRIPALATADTQALFASRAVMADPDFTWSAEAEHLCRLLDGIPLAIELCAAQVGTLSISDLSESLARSLTLDSIGDHRVERHKTMRAALQLSFATLKTEQKLAFLRLSVFDEGFSAAAAAGVAGISLPELSRLVTVSLIEFDGSRYRMLEPTRQLAAEELSLAEARSIRRAHAEWFAEQARNAYDGPFLYDRDPKRFTLERAKWKADSANLRLATEQFETDGRVLSDGMFAIWLVQIWFRLIDHSAASAQAWLSRLEGEDADVGSRIAAHWWMTVSLYSAWNDQNVRAKDLMIRVMPAIWEAGHRDVYALMCMYFEDAEVLNPLTEERELAWKVSINVFVHLNDKDEERHARLQFAHRECLQDPHHELWKEVEDLARQSVLAKDLRSRVIALRLLARRENNWEQRFALLTEALKLQRSVGHWAEVHTLRSIAMGARQLGTPEDEIAGWREAIRRGEEIGYLGTLAEAHLELSRAYCRAGDVPQMLTSMHQALHMIRAQQRAGFLHLGLAHFADLLQKSGEDHAGQDIVRYLRWASENGVFVMREKFEELHPGISQLATNAPPSPFSSSDEIIAWLDGRTETAESGWVTIPSLVAS